MKKITISLLGILLLCNTVYAQLIVDDTDMTPFEDISATGIDLALDDDGEVNIILPFEFDLEGQISTDIRVGNNGGVLFGTTTGDLLAPNDELEGLSPRMVPFWDDLDDQQGAVYWETRGTTPNQRVIIQWNDRPHFPGETETDPATFQLVLFEGSNTILFVYEDVFFNDPDFDNGLSATIGVVSQSNVYEYSFNTPGALEGINAIRFGNPPMSFTECGPTGQIIDPDGTSTDDTITSVISVVDMGVLGADFTLDNLMVDISHVFTGDLDLILTSPMGTSLILSDENGGSGNNYTDTIFQDGGDPINAASPPFTGTFEPQGGTFASTFDGEEINGDWTLTITDVFSSSDAGVLNNYCISFIAFAITCPEDIEVVINPSIIPVGVTTTFTPAFGTVPENIIDGSGLSDFPSITADHDDTTPGNSFIGGDETSGSFDFDLGGTFMLNGVAIWNQNAGGPGTDGEEGIREIVLSSSLDGVTFTPISNSPSLVAIVTDNGPIGPEQFGFDTTEAAFIRLEVLSNHGDDDTGFAEIAFAGTTCEAIATFDPPMVTGTDNTAVQIEGLASGETFPIGTTTNTFEVMGDGGSILTCSFDVTVLDMTAPLFINCPSDTIVNADNEGSPIYTFIDFTENVSAVDNCTSPITITQNPPVGTEANAGDLITVILAAIDEFGNEATCSFEVTVEVSLGIDDISDFANAINIYPNPTRGQLTIDNRSQKEITQVIISDINGRIIEIVETDTSVNNTNISLEKYSSGIYFARINTLNESIVKRIIKQ